MRDMTNWLIGATAVAVIGYFGLIYGGCALDPRCHLQICYHQRICGVTYDGAPQTR